MIKIGVLEFEKTCVLNINGWYGILFNNTKNHLTGIDAIEYLIKPSITEYTCHRIRFFMEFDLALKDAKVRVNKLRKTKHKPKIIRDLRVIEEAEIFIWHEIEIDPIAVFYGIYRVTDLIPTDFGYDGLYAGIKNERR
jgi:hypothetical protein